MTCEFADSASAGSLYDRSCACEYYDAEKGVVSFVVSWIQWRAKPYFGGLPPPHGDLLATGPSIRRVHSTD